MIYSKNEIVLKSIEEEDLEQIRIWRNSDHVRKNMLYQNLISKAEQHNWFLNLGRNNIYFILQIPERIGVLHVKNIDWTKRQGEAGIFIGNENFLNNSISIKSIVFLLEIFFIHLKFTVLRAKVPIKANKALKMNLGLGYKIVSEFKDYLSLEIDKKAFEKNLNLILPNYKLGHFKHNLDHEEERNYLT